MSKPKIGAVRTKIIQEIQTAIDQALFDFDWKDLINAILAEDDNQPWLRLSTLPDKIQAKRTLNIQIIETDNFDPLVTIPFLEAVEEITEDPLPGELNLLIKTFQKAITICKTAKNPNKKA